MCSMFRGRHVMCVRVEHVVVTRQTDWLSLFFCLNRMVGMFEHPLVPTSGKLNLPNSETFLGTSIGLVSSVEFTCGNSFTSWCMMIAARSSIQIVSLTLNQISWCSDGILSQYQMSLLASAAEEPLRNPTKDPRQQSSKPEKWKVHDISFSKHQKLLKNSSWGRSYDDF